MVPHSYLCGGPTAHSGPVARLPKCSTMSRPTTFSESLGAEICDRISEGEGLVSICRSEHMPHRATVHRWLSGETASAPGSFRDRYVEARVLQRDAYAERALSELEAPLPADLGLARIELGRRKELVRSLQWAAGRLSPSKWKTGGSADERRSLSISWRSGRSEE